MNYDDWKAYNSADDEMGKAYDDHTYTLPVVTFSSIDEYAYYAPQITMETEEE